MMALYEFLEPGDSGENIRFRYSGSENIQTDISETSVKQGRPRSLKRTDEFYLTLCQLRQGVTEYIWHSYLMFLSQLSAKLSFHGLILCTLNVAQINIWPSRKLVDETMPQDFKTKYPSTRVIIDCTELRCEMPSSLLLNSQLFSCYKNHTTVKALLRISPKGFSTFIGQLYTSSISDREMVERSGILNLPGDSVRADKALPLWISFLLETLKFPPCLGMSDQMLAEDVFATQEIATLRIHIERAINKVKNFKIFDGVIQLIQLEVLNEMWCVCYVMQFTRYYHQCLNFKLAWCGIRSHKRQLLWPTKLYFFCKQDYGIPHLYIHLSTAYFHWVKYLV